MFRRKPAGAEENPQEENQREENHSGRKRFAERFEEDPGEEDPHLQSGGATVLSERRRQTMATLVLTT